MTTKAEVSPTDGAPTTTSETRPYGLATLEELEEQVKASPESFVVQHLIPEATVNIAVGDSGLGKTAWAYQLGLAVANGVPFIGYETEQGRVLYLDLENGAAQIVDVTRRLKVHLGVAALPGENFLVLSRPSTVTDLTKIVEQYQPSLVIIDTLRACWPEAEKENEGAAKLLNALRMVTREYRTAFVLLHHTKKPNNSTLFGSQPLENAPIMSWLLEAAGARALVNQSDVRMGFDRCKQSDEVALIVKGFTKLKGEFGPIYLGRKLNDAGEVLGYYKVSAVAYLSAADREAYSKLPAESTFTEAVAAYGKTDDPTNKFLQRCIALGILEKVKKGLYRKIGGAST